MKKKRVQCDEYHNDGMFELARFGNMVSLRNNMTEEQAKEYRIFLAERYSEKKTEIDNLILNICEKISVSNPLRLLECATSLNMMSMINTFSEVQHSTDQVFGLRSIEYIQSILVSQESLYDVSSDEDQSMLYMEILANIEELYESVQQFYLYWSAKALEENEDLSDEDISYIVEAQYMGLVRGNRYQFQQIDSLETLILPHSEIMVETYGVTSQEFVDGLKKLEYSLSSGKLDAYKSLHDVFEEFQNESKGKSIEEIEQLLSNQRSSGDGFVEKAFGYDLYDISKVTGWDSRLIKSLSLALGSSGRFLSEGEFAGWPIIDLPVQKNPFIEINGVSYCFDYYNLFDNIYRVLQKDIIRHQKSYADTWSRLQQEASEELVEKLFLSILPGAKSYIGNYYPKNKSLKQMDENDVLILFERTIIIAEVKAGSFTYTPAITDFKAHKKSFQTLVEKASYQCERTLSYIQKNDMVQFYNAHKEKVLSFDHRDYDHIYSFCITVDNFNAFESKIEKIHFLNVNTGTIAISIDDLEVYEKYFSSPLYFLHFLELRKAATKVENLYLNDELDHLGLYIQHNMYERFIRGHSDSSKFMPYGYREELDQYFVSLNLPLEQRFEKPVNQIPDIFKAIIEYLDKEKCSDRVKFSNYILNWSSEAKVQFKNGIHHIMKRQNETKRMFPMITFGEVCYCTFVMQPGIEVIPEDERLEYIYANLLKAGSDKIWYIILDFDENKSFIGINYKILSLSDIDSEGYDRQALSERADSIVSRRTKMILEKSNLKKIYPNDQCPCGSGLKFKKCCGRK